jgi:hypothetical protein
MDDRHVADPDFYARLRLEPGREAAMFPARLREVVELQLELSASHWSQRRRALDDLYRRHGQASDAARFSEVIAAEEAATDPGEEGIRLHQFGRVGFISEPGSRPDAPRIVKTEARYYGYGTESDFNDWLLWSSRGNVDSLFEYALDECRNSGGVQVPEHWTPSTLLVTAHNDLWHCDIRDGYAFYSGIVTQGFRDLVEFAGTLFAAEPAAWLIDANGPEWDQDQAIEQAAFHAWDLTLSHYANGRYAEAIDSLRILRLVGCYHPRVELIARELLGSESVSVRYAVARMLLADASASISDPTLSPGLMSDVVESACAETVPAIAHALVHALRLQGGDACFDALMPVARKAATAHARDAASRALAWVPRDPGRLRRLSELARSRDRRTSRVAMKALAEAKVHGLFSREGEFASDMERAIRESALKFFSGGGRDEVAAAELEYAFANGFVRLEIDGVPGTPGCTATMMTCSDVPLHEEKEHTLEYCGLLNRLPSVSVPTANLSDAELEQESALRLAFSGSAVRFEGRERRKIARALMLVDASDRKTIAQYIDQFWNRRAQGAGVPNLVLSLADESQLGAFLAVLEALPDVADSVRHMLIKGPETGTRQRVEAIRARCPNLETFWGYVHGFPENGAAHIERFIKIKDDSSRFDREQLHGLGGARNIALWSATGGYRPPE